MNELFDDWRPTKNTEQFTVRVWDRACSSRFPQGRGVGVRRGSEQRPLPGEAAILQEDAAALTTMTIVYVERTRTHKKNSLAFQVKGLRGAQDASYELIGGAQCKT
jgi:hypothetical protein